MDFFKLAPSTKRTGLCCVLRCRGKSEKHGRFCRRCRDRRYAISNPISYAWDKLRYSAKRRGISFSLTRSFFVDFCRVTGYIERKGRNKECLSIDRIKSECGYTDGNIQILTVGENSRKSHVDRKLACYHEPTDDDDGDPY